MKDWIGATASRPLLGVAALTAALAGGAHLAGSAQAHVSGCRTDPIVFLSNGYRVRLTAQIAADLQNVTMVTYRLRVPTGVYLDRIVFTGGAFAAKESFQMAADDSPGSYDSDTVAWTNQPSAAVTATTSLLDQSNGVKASGAVSGQQGQDLKVHVHG